VDDEAPAITVVSPGNGITIAEDQPSIEAALSDGAGSGIDEDSIVMTLNDEIVEHNYDSGALTYTPAEPLADGAIIPSPSAWPTRWTTLLKKPGPSLWISLLRR